MTVAEKPITERLYTADELFAFPIDWHYELFEGRLEEMMSPTGGEHGLFTADLAVEIGYFVRASDLGRCFAAETGFLLRRNPDTVLAPDFAFVAKDRLPPSPARGYWHVVPDLVLETRSPDDRPASVARKVNRWLAAGVRLVLDLDPAAQALTVHRPNQPPVPLMPTETLEGYDLLPGFALPLIRLFTDAGP
jgi:Uma2 family endonuclease